MPGVSEAMFIGIDWGTSNGRFMLVADDGCVLEQRSAPGIAKFAGASAIEDACFAAISGWLDVYGMLPVIMVGPVGSNIGWHPVGYVPVPATLDAVISRVVRFEARGVTFHLLPGVDTQGAAGLPDVMRGEETQIFGALGDARALVCLPGTHAKWVQVDGGVITRFHTAMTGELIDIIGRGSILLNPKRAPAAVVGDAFRDGVRTVRDHATGLEVLLFSVRSRQIAGTLSDGDAESYLTGLCIGADIRSALAMIPDQQSVILIGSPILCGLYGEALMMFGRTSQVIDGDRAVVDGLCQAYRMLMQ